jgi:hypothetical protein
LRISNFGFFGFSFSIRIPQSAFRNLVAGLSGVTQFGIRNVEFGIFISFFPFRIPQSAFRISIARPAQEMRVVSWFLRGTPLLPGRAMLEI